MTPARTITRINRPALRRFVTLSLLAGLLLAYLPLSAGRDAGAATMVPGGIVTVTTDILNVRSGPGTDRAIVGRLYQGDHVTVTAVGEYANGYTWAQVGWEAGSPIGWVAAEYLGEAGGGATPGFAAGDRVLVDAGALNFRTSPTTAATVIRPLAYGTLLTITDGPVSADGYTWYRGKTTEATGGQTGWAIGQAMITAPAEMPDPSLLFDPGTPAHVNTDLLRLRSDPSMSGATLASLSLGTTLTVTGMPVGADGHSWYPVTTAAGTAGWVAGTYLAGGVGGASSGALVVGSPARVDTSVLNMRTGPGLGAGVRGQLFSGAWLMIVSGPEGADGYQWYEVDTSTGETGWVIGEALIPER